MNVVVCEFLNFSESEFFVVLGDQLVFEHFFQMFVAVTADIADCRPMLFENFVDVLGEGFAPLFGERRDGRLPRTRVDLYLIRNYEQSRIETASGHALSVYRLPSWRLSR